MDLKSLIRTIPDYPKPGVLFRDITTLLKDPAGMRQAVDQLAGPFRGLGIDKVAGIEARGFILGGAVAVALCAGFVLVRKQGKLPSETIGREYELEYGSDGLEIHTDAVSPGDRVLVVDDLIATGGTGEAAIRIIEQSRGTIAGFAVIVDLPDLGGRQRIEAAGHKVVCLCEFEGE